MRIKLKELREKSNLTQNEIANIVGIARSTYTNIELGDKNPSFNVALKIKDALNTNEDDIFLNTDVPMGNNR